MNSSKEQEARIKCDCYPSIGKVKMGEKAVQTEDQTLQIQRMAAWWGAGINNGRRVKVCEGKETGDRFRS